MGHHATGIFSEPKTAEHTVALVVGDDHTRTGPIPLALAHAGFDTREVFTTDEAERTVARQGVKKCVLVVDGSALDRRDGCGTWNEFLERHRGLPAVAVARWGASPGTQLAGVGAAHRILLDRPFDAAAVVAAAKRASAGRALAVRRARHPIQQAG